MSEHIIEFTNAAVEHIRKMMTRHANAIGFRLSVKQAGCSGYRYQPEIITQASEQDYPVITTQGLAVFIDADSKSLIQGTKVDFITKGLGQQLIFQNPNMEGECGCGESFYPKQESSEDETNQH